MDLEGLPKETLIKMIRMFSKNWLAVDGLWFQAVEDEFGFEAAFRLDMQMWAKQAVIEARRIKEISKIVLEKYKGKVPDDIEELVKLPGVGYKTGACVMVYAFKKPDIPVDIHVAIISQRLNWTREKNPDNIRLDLMKKVPNKYWILLNELLVKFGQRICITRKPLCYKCPIVDLCPFKQKNLTSGIQT